MWDIRYIHGNNGVAPRRSMGSATTATAQSHLQKDTTKLACIPSSQNPQVKGACRSVKFSPSPSIDLLAFAEHVSYVNFVDARTFDGKQSVRVSPPGTDMHISGLAWTPDSRSVFMGKCAVFVFSIYELNGMSKEWRRRCSSSRWTRFRVGHFPVARSSDQGDRSGAFLISFCSWLQQ